MELFSTVKAEFESEEVLPATTPPEAWLRLKNVLTGHETSDTFSLSPAYFLLTGRRGLHLLRNGTSTLLAARHPNRPRRTIIFPEVGTDVPGRLTVDVLRAAAATSTPVQLGRYRMTQIRSVDLMIRAATDQEIRITAHREPVLDWRYPARILSVQDTADLQGAQFATIRNKVRIARRNAIAVPVDGDTPSDLLLTAYERWHDRHATLDEAARREWTMYHEIVRLRDLLSSRLHGLLFMSSGRPAGFTLWEGLDGGVATLLVSIADPTITGLADLQIVATCSQLSEYGYERLNLGGSETSGLDSFKAKFAPIESVMLHSAMIATSHPDMRWRRSARSEIDLRQDREQLDRGEVGPAPF